MPNKKEPLSLIVIKTLLAVIIFTGIGTIIIGGGWLIGNNQAIKPPLAKKEPREEAKIKENIITVTGELHYSGHPFSQWVIGSYVIGGERFKEIIDYGAGSKFEITGTMKQEKRCIPTAGKFSCYKEVVLHIQSYKVLYSFNDEKKKLQTEIDKLPLKKFQDYIKFCQNKRPKQISENFANDFVINCYAYSASKLASIESVDSIKLCEEIESSFGVNYRGKVWDCLSNLNALTMKICDEIQKVKIASIHTHIKDKAISTCYRHVAFNLNNPKLCEKVTDKYQHGYCYIDLAKLNNDSDICDDIKYDGGIPSYRDTCYAAVEDKKVRD